MRSHTSNPPPLPEVDFDTGKPLGSGEYPLADKTYAKLAERLTTDNDVQLTPQLRADVLAFFDHHTGPNAVEQQPAEWAKVRDALSKLKQTQPAAAPGAGNS